MYILWMLLALAGCSSVREQTQTGKIVRLDQALDQIVAPSARIELVASGFSFTEGPVWIIPGALLFSDIPNNTIHKMSPAGRVSVFRKPSGFDGSGAPKGAFIGSNGLTLDREGRLIICEHGNRRITRLEHNARITVLVDRYQGRRLNSPNDAVVKSDGAIYFTDPPYGLPKQDGDPAKELKFNGIYRLSGESLQLLSSALSMPNGLAFSPGEKYLYVANSDPKRKIWMRFEVNRDGTLSGGETFFDATRETAEGLPDGLKVDELGNLYCTGPGGVWIFSPSGKHLGTIQLPETPANCAWGNPDGDTLYITARTSLYRIKLRNPGLRP
jgi:gluconolactonase